MHAVSLKKIAHVELIRELDWIARHELSLSERAISQGCQLLVAKGGSEWVSGAGERSNQKPSPREQSPVFKVRMPAAEIALFQRCQPG